MEQHPIEHCSLGMAGAVNCDHSNRLCRDFKDEKIFKELPLIPTEWADEFDLKVILKEDPIHIIPEGVLFLTNIQQLEERENKNVPHTFSKPPYGTLLKIEANGEKDGRTKDMEVNLFHEDGYMFTAIPVVACLLQYLDGSIKKPGLWTQANFVEPNRFMKDMERMGVHVQIQDKSGNSI